MGMISSPISVLIPSGSTGSAIFSGSVLQNFADITIYAPTLNGTAHLQVSPTLSTATSSFFNVQDPMAGGSAAGIVSLSANVANVIDHIPGAAGFRFTTNLAQSGSREFIVVGRMAPRVKVLPAQDVFPITFSDLGS